MRAWTKEGLVLGLCNRADLQRDFGWMSENISITNYNVNSNNGRTYYNSILSATYQSNVLCDTHYTVEQHKKYMLSGLEHNSTQRLGKSHIWPFSPQTDHNSAQWKTGDQEICAQIGKHLRESGVRNTKMHLFSSKDNWSFKLKEMNFTENK